MEQTLENNESISEKIVKNPRRMLIFMLFFFHKELNVSQISKLLHSSKATISRHLKIMAEEGILESREVEKPGIFNPVYYTLPAQQLLSMLPTELKADPSKLEPAERKEFYSNAITTMKSMIKLMTFGFQLFNPLLENMEEVLAQDDKDAIPQVDKLFDDYFYKTKRMDFETIMLSESVLPQVNELWKDFRKKVEQLEKKEGNEKSYIMLESLVPLKELVEFSAIKAEKKK